MEEQRDENLWKIAQKRVAFRKHLYTYLIINSFFWAIWFFGGMRTSEDGAPWPVWPALGWGIGLAFNYFSAYVSHDHVNTEKEYEKLRQEKERRV